MSSRGGLQSDEGSAGLATKQIPRSARDDNFGFRTPLANTQSTSPPAKLPALRHDREKSGSKGWNRLVPTQVSTAKSSWPRPACQRRTDAHSSGIRFARFRNLSFAWPPIFCSLRHADHHIHGQAEAVDVVIDGEFQRRINASLLFVAAHMHVVVVRAPIGQPVNQLRIAVKIEDDRLVDREERIEIPIGKPVRMFACSVAA